MRLAPAAATVALMLLLQPSQSSQPTRAEAPAGPATRRLGCLWCDCVWCDSRTMQPQPQQRSARRRLQGDLLNVSSTTLCDEANAQLSAELQVDCLKAENSTEPTCTSSVCPLPPVVDCAVLGAGWLDGECGSCVPAKGVSDDTCIATYADLQEARGWDTGNQADDCLPGCDFFDPKYAQAGNETDANATEEAPKPASLDFAWFAIGVVLCLVGTPLCVFAARTWDPNYSDAGQRAPGNGAPDKDQESEDGQPPAGEEAEAEADDVENPLGAQATS